MDKKMIKAQTLKGFRDFLPKDAIKRQKITDILKGIFESFGFDPLETPAVEYAETLIGKYGTEADKLLYLFEDRGGRKVGLRYDQTVPLSRVIAQYGNNLPIPFKRYQIQPVWRAENTQKGRYREFLQCDIDTTGSSSPLADAEIIACTLTALGELGFNDAQMYINDRTMFDKLGISKKEVTILDKLDKIGKEQVINQLIDSGRSRANELFNELEKLQPTEWLTDIFSALTSLGIDRSQVRFDPFLARGLDYYTSTIFEVKTPSFPQGSIAGGGRYDDLIGIFSGVKTPAVGLAFGFDRIIEAMDILGITTTQATATKVFVTIFSPETQDASPEIARKLRSKGIAAETALDPKTKLDRQLKYADKKAIPWIVIQGPDEVARNAVKLKNMQTQQQQELTVKQVIEKFNSRNSL